MICEPVHNDLCLITFSVLQTIVLIHPFKCLRVDFKMCFEKLCFPFHLTASVP